VYKVLYSEGLEIIYTTDGGCHAWDMGTDTKDQFANLCVTSVERSMTVIDTIRNQLWCQLLALMYMFWRRRSFFHSVAFP
jgi:hypothetical protein